MNIEIGHCLAGTMLASALFLAGCGNGGNDGHADHAAEEPGRSVVTTGKEDTALDAVPDAVIQAARQVRPELEISASEYEVRDGHEYYDLAGTLPDGSELELDLTSVDGVWSVVEVQRDIALEQVPDGVRQALAERKPDWPPVRIIESDQGNGLIVYEFFGPGPDAEEIKIEVKWENDVAEALRDEWVH